MQLNLEQKQIEYLKNKKIVIAGYGNQGKAQALNLADCGLDVSIALRNGSKTYELAKSDGFNIFNPDEGSQKADILAMLIPDEIQADFYKKHVHENLRKNCTLLFSHGYNIAFSMIKPQKYLDVVLVSPKGAGYKLRSEFLENRGIPSLIAVHQNNSSNAYNTAYAYATSLGSARSAILETTFKEETETDLFSEQAVLCGGIPELIKASYDILIKNGYKKEIAYIECLHEVKLIADLIYQLGISGMRKAISGTARFGGISKGNKVITNDTIKSLEKILLDIKNGEFADSWLKENIDGQKTLTEAVKNEAELDIEITGKKVRSLFGINEV